MKYCCKFIKDHVWVLRKHLTSDKRIVNKEYKHRFGTYPNLRQPVTFNEKLQWLKLYYRPQGFHKYVDKFEVRHYIHEKVGRQYLNELLGVWDHPNDIDFEALPNSFAIKATHASATNLICPDKSVIDWDVEKRQLMKYLDYDLYQISKEWAYKHVKPRLIAEAFLGEDGLPPNDYKIFCFNGLPKLIQVDLARFSGHKRIMMSTEWDALPIKYAYPLPEPPPDPPETLHEMLDLAIVLSQPFPFVRVDFYCVKGHTYVGELTFYPESGYKHFSPTSWDAKLGSWLTLPIATH